MEEVQAKTIVGKDCRITIPIKIREVCHIEEGDVLNFKVVNGKLEVEVLEK